jgi:hypothetical protein
MNSRPPKTPPFFDASGQGTHSSPEGVQPGGMQEPQEVLNLGPKVREQEAERACLANEVVEITADQQYFLERYVRLAELIAEIEDLLGTKEETRG